MLNRKLLVVLTLFTLTIFRAPAQDAFLVDKVVATVGNSSVLYSEVLTAMQQIQRSQREQGIVSQKDPFTDALEQLVVQKILYNQAQIDSLKVDHVQIMADVQRMIDSDVASQGSIAGVEQKYGKPLYAVKADMMNQFEEMRYIQAMEAEIRKNVTISTREVEKYYRSLPKDSLPIVPEQYSFSQISMLPPSKDAAILRVKQRLLDYKERILNGERFQALAILYSIDQNTAPSGGEMGPVSKDELSRNFGDALVRLKPDQISEVVETEYGFHIIQLIEKQGNNYRFRHILLKPTYTPEEKAAVNSTLDSLANRIRSGNITFADAAARYSDDKYSRNNGGKATNIDIMTRFGISDPKSAQTYFFKDELLVAEYAQIRNMKPGDISNAFYTTDMYGNELGKIIRLDEIKPEHEADLSDDYMIVENMALAEKQAAEFKKWLDKKAATMYISIDERFRDLDFSYEFMKKK